MKKCCLFSIMMIAALLLCAAASAETLYSGTCGDALTWKLDDQGVLTISGTGGMTDYSFAGSPWNNQRSLVKKVVIEDGVTRIGASAFMSCTALSEITIPDTVTTIGEWAMDGTGLPSVTIPAGVTSIGDRALSTNYKLTNIYVQSGSSSFVDVDGVLFTKDGTKLIQFPAGREGTYAVPDGVTHIGVLAFGWAQKLTAITLPDTLREIDEHAFQAAIRLTRINIPEGVTELLEYTFSSCVKLEEITLPASLKNIGKNVFARCDHLKNVYYGGIKPQWNAISIIGGNEPLAAANIICREMKTAVLPANLTAIDAEAFTGAVFDAVIVPDGCASIGSRAFADCKNLYQVSLPSTAVNIAEDAFEGSENAVIEYRN